MPEISLRIWRSTAPRRPSVRNKLTRKRSLCCETIAAVEVVNILRRMAREPKAPIENLRVDRRPVHSGDAAMHAQGQGVSLAQNQVGGSRLYGDFADLLERS